MTEGDVRSAYQRKTTLIRQNEHVIKLSIRLTADVMTLDSKRQRNGMPIHGAIHCKSSIFCFFLVSLVIASRDISTAVLNSFVTSVLFHLERIRMDGGQEEKMYKTSQFPVI